MTALGHNNTDLELRARAGRELLEVIERAMEDDRFYGRDQRTPEDIRAAVRRLGPVLR